MPAHLLLAELWSPAALGLPDVKMPRPLWFHKLPDMSVLPLRLQKWCVPQTRLKEQRQNLQPHSHVSRDLHLTLVLVKACSATADLAEPAKETLPEVTVGKSTDTVDIIRVQHHELKEKQTSKVHSIPTGKGLANQIRSGEVFPAGGGTSHQKSLNLCS